MSRFTNPVPQFFLDDGSVASFGRMYFYENNNFAVFKKTYSQPDNTVENTSPVKLTGSGRLPSCFGEGLYSVKFYSANPENPDEDGTLIWSRNDVSLSELTGQFELWNAAETYTINDIAKDPTDGLYYQLWGAPTSKGEQPSTAPTKWELVIFLTGYNNNKPYEEGDNVVFDGYIYRANTDVVGVTPPNVQWDNLTFNDTVEDLPASGSGDFTSGTVSCTRIGRVVTISSAGNMTHSNLSSPSTALNFIPALYRPSIGATTVYFIRQTTALIAMVNIRFDGILNIQYLDFAGNPVSSTTTASPFCISFNV